MLALQVYVNNDAGQNATDAASLTLGRIFNTYVDSDLISLGMCEDCYDRLDSDILLVRLDDVPGSLSRLLNLIAGLKANVLDIRHERHIKDAPLYVTHVELELETRGESHCEEISRKLMEKGYHVEIR